MIENDSNDYSDSARIDDRRESPRTTLFSSDNLSDKVRKIKGT